MCFIFCLYTVLFDLGKYVTNVRKFRVFLVIFDTCDVVYNWFISLLPPILLDNLYGWYALSISKQLETVNFFCGKIWAIAITDSIVFNVYFLSKFKSPLN